MTTELGGILAVPNLGGLSAHLQLSLTIVYVGSILSGQWVGTRWVFAKSEPFTILYAVSNLSGNPRVFAESDSFTISLCTRAVLCG